MHLIILPYYCEKEIENFCKIADIWKQLTKTKLEYEFILAAQFDFKPSQKLENVFSKIAPIHHLRCEIKGKGLRHPKKGYSMDGPTAMFWNSMEYITLNFEDDGDFSLWLEHDMIPLVPDWLDQLDEEWKEGEQIVMGRYMNMNRPHINGGACYSKSLADILYKQRGRPKKPFDLEMFQFVKGRHKRTKLIEFWFQAKTMGKRVPQQETVLLHGVQDNSAIEYTIKRNNLSDGSV